MSLQLVPLSALPWCGLARTESSGLSGTTPVSTCFVSAPHQQACVWLSPCLSDCFPCVASIASVNIYCRDLLPSTRDKLLLLPIMILEGMEALHCVAASAYQPQLPLALPTSSAGASFPPYKGLISIILAWFIAPVLSGAAAALFFFIARTAVLRRKNAYAVSFWILPLAVLATVWGEMWPAAHCQPALLCGTSSLCFAWLASSALLPPVCPAEGFSETTHWLSCRGAVCMYFVFTKGAKKVLSSKSSWNDAKAAWVSALIAGGTAVLVAVVALPLLRWRASKAYDE